MTKNKTQVVNPPAGPDNRAPEAQPNEPLSGSKKVKNRNHSRQNHGEGS
jgi:small acid-soluble spore protein P (minor)